MAELYKSLSMWDVVRGIIHSKLGRIKPETREALEAEATNDSVQAFIIYRTALNTQWPEEPDPAEVHLWEECYASCAAKLGQWSELENFVENRLLKDEAGQVSLNQVWTLPRPAVSVLPSIVNSKLMNILDGSEIDRNLNAFIDSALGEPNHRDLLESTLPLPLAIMSAHQQKMAQARHYITLATSKVLLTLAQSSLLTPKPLTVLEAFVKEPTEDWKEFVRELEGNLDESKIEMFSEERMRRLKEKLTGFNPAYVTVWALSKNKAVRRDPTAFEELKKVVLGLNCESARANMDRTGLTIHQQVDILLEQATDPNILGRTWVGWSPFI
ncbi:hypothetical protein O3P69_008916 [Scylla paramamosain]|uniref:FATC domain-containing protein n=1 Tax=Scylla paramamosain TaxID=85552 RepID=A0AAW0TPD8_SCYPA